MAEPGKYAEAVMWSYAVSIALIAALIAASLWRARVTRRQLAEMEARARQDG